MSYGNSPGEHVQHAAVIHTTTYCGSVEKACLRMKIPVLSITDSAVNHTHTVLSVAHELMEVQGGLLALANLAF